MKAIYSVILLSFIIYPINSYSVPIKEIDVEDYYYLSTSGFVENKLVMVKRVDLTRNRVKIQYKNGTVDWVNASNLLSTSANTYEKVADSLAIVGSLACLGSDNVTKCMNDVRKMRARDTDIEYSSKAQKRKREREKPKPGYVRKGTEFQWKSGLKHAKFPNILSDLKEGYWVADPGYVFPKKNSLIARWEAGRKHPNYKNIVSAKKEGYWDANPGYIFPEKNSLIIRWDVGRKHPNYKNIVSAKKEGYWNAEPGYTFPKKNNLIARWEAWRKHPKIENLFSSTKEGHWVPAYGYKFSSIFGLFVAKKELFEIVDKKYSSPRPNYVIWKTKKKNP